MKRGETVATQTTEDENAVALNGGREGTGGFLLGFSNRSFEESSKFAVS